jgi:hypothetical protein
MPHPSSRSPASARVAMHRYACNLYGTPRVHRRDDGTIAVELGILPSGSPLTLDPASLEWLLDLESAAREAWAAGKVRAGTPVTP